MEVQIASSGELGINASELAALAFEAGGAGHRTFRSDSEVTAWEAECNRDWFEQRFRRSDAAFVALTNGELVGVCALIDGEVSIYCRQRSRGVGTALLARLLEWSHQQGHTQLAAEIHSFNVPCRRLFEKAGFRVTHTSPSPLFPGATFDRLVYERTSEHRI